LPDGHIRALLETGGAKFNVSTDLKHALIDSTFDHISNHRDEYDPGKIDVSVKRAIRGVVERWIDILGSTGRA
jgi:fructose/tagatose bisphosphate aldolase